MDVKIKRVYDTPSESDGYRVLIDRLWPRGLSKEHARVDLWDKEVAPTPTLRREWHGDPNAHAPARFAAFASDYRRELASGPASDALDELVTLAQEHESLTLVYGAKDEHVNHAVVLLEALTERAKSH
ncbi:DUF488 domain-containing protein [Leucobacter sp. HY1908]